ncbi:uncharacterized protein G2W53_008346 [Senna tora]|uniref:Uncharacterized protein n=1 Tax=Senna tora TaxID=362788 RepID=A0A835CF51_9FABA|nr:uncharacterized protein G2W53_008346 [Senna tora]
MGLAQPNRHKLPHANHYLRTKCAR